MSVETVLETFHQLMRVLHSEHARRGVDAWHDCPLTVPQLRALSLIAANDRGLSSRDLAIALGVGASAITPLVDRLVERGYVRRTEDIHDRRIARLHPTEAGTDMLDRMHAVKDDVLRDALAQLDPTELHDIGAALDVLRAAVQRTQLPKRDTHPFPEEIPA